MAQTWWIIIIWGIVHSVCAKWKEETLVMSFSIFPLFMQLTHRTSRLFSGSQKLESRLVESAATV